MFGKVLGQLRAKLFSQTVVLLFHRVAHLQTDHLKLSLKPSDFRTLLRRLKNEVEFTSISDIFSKKIQNGKVRVVITFDDGYEDNYNFAAPILDELGIPATFFISTAYLDSDREIWTSDLDRIFFHESKKKSFEIAFENCGKAIIYQNPAEAYSAVKKKMFGMTFQEKQSFLARLCGDLKVACKARQEYRFLSRTQVAEMSRNSLFTIGAHTHSHPKLSLLKSEDQIFEIFKSKEILEKTVSKSIEYFAFPFGQKSDFDRSSVDACKKAGFAAAFTAYPGNCDLLSSRFEIPRFNSSSGEIPGYL